MFCSYVLSHAPSTGRRRRAGSESYVDFHWIFQSRAAPTTTDYIHIRGIARAEEWTSAYLPGLYPPRESLRTIHPPARRRRPDVSHVTHTHYLA